MSQPKKPAKAESTVIKPMAKKDRFKNLGGEIGNPPFPNGRKNMPYAPTKMGGAKNGKTMSKAKDGKSFPDLNKDGKITKADILKGRGVIAKKGATIKKAQSGINTLLPGGYAPKSREEKYNNYPSSKSAPKAKAKPKSSIQEATPQEVKKYGMMGSQQAKSGAKMKKCKYGCN